VGPRAGLDAVVKKKIPSPPPPPTRIEQLQLWNRTFLYALIIYLNASKTTVLLACNVFSLQYFPLVAGQMRLEYAIYK